LRVSIFNYIIIKRRRVITNDSEIKFKSTIDEKDELLLESHRKGDTMSNTIRKALNQYFEKEIFLIQD